MGFSGRKYNVDENYFDVIDTSEKAYILGFAAADGYNSGRSLSFRVQKGDFEVLDFIRNQICKELPIHVYNNLIDLTINSTKISKDLTKHEIIKKKSLCLKFPKLEEKFISSFIRGCFDGDGCVIYRKYKDGRKQLGIIFSYVSASLEFIKSFELILRNNCNIPERKITMHNNSYYLKYSGPRQVEKIFDFLYENSCFHLNRKFEKLNNYCN